MGILRTDKISGLETPTAVTGSVLFDGTNDDLQIADSNDFTFAKNDFTIEFWRYKQVIAIDTYVAKYGGSANTDRTFWCGQGTDGVEQFYWYSGSSVYSISSAVGSDIKPFPINTWAHYAAVRYNGTMTLYIDGVEAASTTTNVDVTLNDTSEVLRVGGENTGVYDYQGYISNLRILNGTALYTSEFTPPVHELEVIGDTVLLCCNSSDSAGAEATGKSITVNGDAAASTFSPGLTRDFTFGTEFRGVTTFDTQGYFVPPSGTTEQRGRGRGLFGGGDISPAITNTISYIQIQTQGNAQDFGDLTVARYAKGLGSSTRGLFTGGYFPSSPSYVNTIDFVTIATTGNAQDFGDINDTKNDVGCLGNETRGIMAGGDNNNTPKNTIDFVTIASLGDATDFGDLTVARADIASFSSSTRGVMAGGTDVPNAQNVIDYITIASAGDAVDFGDTLATIYSAGGCSSSTRGVIGGGQTPSTVNTIQYVTISTTGNSQDFGDLTEGRRFVGASSNKISGVFAGGQNSPSNAQLNTMNYVTIATTGNTKDFGDLMTTRQTVGALSDSHGGLS